MTNHQYGPKGHIVDAFLAHLKQMTKAERVIVAAARGATDYAALDAALDAAQDAAEEATEHAPWHAAMEAVRNAAWYPEEENVARKTAWRTAREGTLEILGADLLRERGQPFFFLPMFGFADEQAIIKQESTV
jgi:hypothetical protein